MDIINSKKWGNKMICPKCGEINNENAKFCKKCGESLESNPIQNTQKSTDKNKIIIVALIAIIAILAIGGLYVGGFLKGEIPLQTADFEVFKMNVPVESNFQVSASVPSYGDIGGFKYWQNNGKYSDEVFATGVSTIGNGIPSQMQYDRQVDGITIFKDKSGSGIHMATLEKDGFSFFVMGKDVDTMVKMLKTVQITNKDALNAESSKQTPSVSQDTTSSAPASSSTPSSISILGGSFSTGSGDADKTYARINVGTAHAGQNVIVQIYYSRDGKSLNNGNMVPATVHSDGYLEIASADAYKFYPDYATIKIYDSNSKLLTTQSVSLSPSAGTQTF